MRRATHAQAITRIPSMTHVGSVNLCYGIDTPSLLVGHTGNIVLLPGLIAMVEITTGCLILWRLWQTSDAAPESGAATRANIWSRRGRIAPKRWALFALAVLTGIVGLSLWAVLHESKGIPYLILAGIAVF